MTDEVLSKIAAAHKVIVELCNGDRKWTMSVPARPDYDPDLVIGGALRAALSRAKAAEKENAALRGQLCRGKEEMEALSVECHRTACHVRLSIFKERMRKELSPTSPCVHAEEAKRLREEVELIDRILSDERNPLFKSNPYKEWAKNMVAELRRAKGGK